MSEFKICKDMVILSESLFKDYQDVSECFGNTVKGEGYSETDSNCTPANCDLVEPCKLLCGEVPGYLKGAEPTSEAPVEKIVEPKEPLETPTTNDSYDRESVKCLVIHTLNNLKLSPEVVSSATRDKVFIGTENKFIVTKRALRLPDIEDGAVLGLTQAQWSAVNKGIDIPFDAGVHWVELTQAVMGKTVVFNQPVEQEAKSSLFTQEVPDITEDIEDVPEVADVSSVSATTFESKPGLESGRITKSLQLLKYDNGYTEVRVTFVTGAGETTELLATLRKAFE